MLTKSPSQSPAEHSSRSTAGTCILPKHWFAYKPLDAAASCCTTMSTAAHDTELPAVPPLDLQHCLCCRNTRSAVHGRILLTCAGTIWQWHAAKLLALPCHPPHRQAAQMHVQNPQLLFVGCPNTLPAQQAGRVVHVPNSLHSESTDSAATNCCAASCVLCNCLLPKNASKDVAGILAASCPRQTDRHTCHAPHAVCRQGVVCQLKLGKAAIGLIRQTAERCASLQCDSAWQASCMHEKGVGQSSAQCHITDMCPPPQAPRHQHLNKHMQVQSPCPHTEAPLPVDTNTRSQDTSAG